MTTWKSPTLNLKLEQHGLKVIISKHLVWDATQTLGALCFQAHVKAQTTLSVVECEKFSEEHAPDKYYY